MNVSVLAVVFCRQFSKNRQLQTKLLVFEICWQNTTAITQKFKEKELWHNSSLLITSYLSIALCKIMPCLEAIKKAKKLLVFGENDCHILSNFWQTHIFWECDHISRTYHQINYRSIWFSKVTVILLMMAQVLFLIFFPKKNHTLMSLAMDQSKLTTFHTTETKTKRSSKMLKNKYI